MAMQKIVNVIGESKFVRNFYAKDHGAVVKDNNDSDIKDDSGCDVNDNEYNNSFNMKDDISCD